MVAVCIEHMFDTTVAWLTIIIAAVLAALVAYIAGRAAGAHAARAESGRQTAAMRAEIDDMRGRLGASDARAVEYRTRAEGLGRQLDFVTRQLSQAQQAEQRRIEREKEQTAAAEERRRQEQAGKLQEQGKVLSALAPVQKNLDVLQRKVAQIEEGRKQEIGVLGERLKGLGEQQGRLDRETSSLASALRNNKIRGAWGEAQLKNIVESAGLLEHVDFDTQVVVTDVNGNTQRPDMVVHLPGGKTIPIDAKAPYSNYERACAIPDTASDEELARKASLLKAHARDMREHVKTLGDRAYWNAFETAPDFVVAFIPNESLLQAALETDPTLMDDAFARKVALTSPVTLWAVLKSVAYSWQQQSLSDDARTLFKLSRELYERFAVLGSRATKLGHAISRTVGAYNQFASSLESRVLVTARKLQRIEPSKAIAPVDMIDQDQANIRELTAPETQPGEREDPQR